MERFWNKVNKTITCWLWIAGKDSCGYGNFKLNGKVEKAHRLSLTLFGTDIPEGLCVLHRCDTPCCVNPEHLFLGTRKDNWDDMRSKKRNKGAPRERNWNHKLTSSQVKEIREKYSSREVSTEKIAKLYGVSQPAISYILIGKTWKGNF